MTRKTVKECQAEVKAMSDAERLKTFGNLNNWLAARGWTEKEFLEVAGAERDAREAAEQLAFSQSRNYPLDNKILAPKE